MKLRPDITVVAQSFGEREPAEHLVDRFLMGYTQTGKWVSPGDSKVHLYVQSGARGEAIAQRQADFGMQTFDSLQKAAAGAEALILVPDECATLVADEFIGAAMDVVRTGAQVFVHGALASSAAVARNLVRIAEFRKVQLFSGSFFPTAPRLPPVDVPRGVALVETVVVAAGDPSQLEFRALDTVLPFLERRAGGESGIAAVRALAGDSVWRAQNDRQWSRELLGAALSRSSTPEGTGESESRPHNQLGLGEVRRLANDPVAYVIDHVDGLRTTVLLLNGVVREMNVATRTSDGDIISTQLYEQPSMWRYKPPPNVHQWTSLVACLDTSFRSRALPWPTQRGVLTASLLETMRAARARLQFSVEGPGSALAYRNASPSTFER